MSYDLAVYTRDGASAADVDSLVSAGAGLKPETRVGSCLTVVRGSKSRYSFSVGGPDNLEAEDVPDEVTAVLLGARHYWSVAVEGTSSTEIPHAIRFARRLAESLDGAVVDQQNGEVWTRSKSRIVARPAREERITTVDFQWFCLRGDLPDDVGALYVDTVSRFLPEALPRRFGEYEPFQGKYIDGGRDTFRAAWRDATGLLFFSGSGPVCHGALWGGPSERFPTKFWSMSISMLLGPLRDERWRQATQRVFTSIADDLRCFFASGQVTRGHLWNGRTLAADNRTEWAEHSYRREGWMGLHPRPMWWTWLGGPYSDAVDSLPADRCMATASGVLFRNSEEPQSHDDLEGLQRWLPFDLFASLAPNERNVRPAPLVAAPRIPVALL